MKILALSTIALIGVTLISGQAIGANFGALTLKAGETQTVDIGATSRNMRVCNDFFSSGQIVVTVGGNIPHYLSPGVCAEDIGDRVTFQSQASGPATVEFRSLNDVSVFAQ
jgi:hypothetical protein